MTARTALILATRRSISVTRAWTGADVTVPDRTATTIWSVLPDAAGKSFCSSWRAWADSVLGSWNREAKLVPATCPTAMVATSRTSQPPRTMRRCRKHQLASVRNRTSGGKRGGPSLPARIQDLPSRLQGASQRPGRSFDPMTDLSSTPNEPPPRSGRTAPPTDQPTDPPTGVRVRRHRRTRPAVVATLAAGALATGTVAGHSLWPASAGSHPAASAPAGTPDAGGTPSAAAGSVTALDQAITASDELDGAGETLSHLIETDADVRSGDSGGPLVDNTGKVVGMDTAAAQGFSLQSATSGASEGYAIPIARALAIAHQIETGVSSATVHVGPTAFLGVLVSSPADSPFGAARTPGAMVSSVVPGSAAASAGLAAGDVITGIDGRTVTGPATLTELLAGDQPGRSITIGWTDASGGSHTATTALQAGPPA